MDATQFDMKFMSLTNLIATAYKVKPYQIPGPDWMKTQLWEIHARLPEGSTKEQIPEMLQSLLAERFKLTFHRESREHPVYALTVSKSGLKMKEAVEEPATPAPEADAAKSTAPKESGGKEAMTFSTPEGEMKVNMKQQGNTVTVDVGKAGKMQMIIRDVLRAGDVGRRHRAGPTTSRQPATSAISPCSTPSRRSSRSGRACP